MRKIVEKIWTKVSQNIQLRNVVLHWVLFVQSFQYSRNFNQNPGPAFGGGVVGMTVDSTDSVSPGSSRRGINRVPSQGEQEKIPCRWQRAILN
jgi:hypothetical protein